MVPTDPAPELFHGATVLGPLTRSVGDAALMLDVLAGTGETAASFVAAASRPPRRLRIAVSWRIPWSPLPARLDPEVRAAVERLAGVLAGLGHELIDEDPRYRASVLNVVPRLAVGLCDHVQLVPDRTVLDPRTRENARMARLMRGPGLALARATERRLARRIGAIFRRADVVLTPTTALPPPTAGASLRLSLRETNRATIAAAGGYTVPWNAVGWPAINVPAGLTEAGLPVGAQLLGPADSEPLLLALAAQLEQSERWHERWPPV